MFIAQVEVLLITVKIFLTLLFIYLKNSQKELCLYTHSFIAIKVLWTFITTYLDFGNSFYQGID